VVLVHGSVSRHDLYDQLKAEGNIPQVYIAGSVRRLLRDRHPEPLSRVARELAVGRSQAAAGTEARRGSQPRRARSMGERRIERARADLRRERASRKPAFPRRRGREASGTPSKKMFPKWIRFTRDGRWAHVSNGGRGEHAKPDVDRTTTPLHRGPLTRGQAERGLFPLRQRLPRRCGEPLVDAMVTTASSTVAAPRRKTRQSPSIQPASATAG